MSFINFKIKINLFLEESMFKKIGRINLLKFL